MLAEIDFSKEFFVKNSKKYWAGRGGDHEITKLPMGGGVNEKWFVIHDMLYSCTTHLYFAFVD